MKKLILSLVAVVLVVGCLILGVYLLTKPRNEGEDNGDNGSTAGDVHVHSFIEVEDERYLASEPAMCGHPVHYYYSCACGEKSTDTFYGTAQHILVDGICTRCDSGASKGFTFSEYDKELLTDDGSCTDSDVVIPQISPSGTYVSRIGNRAFAGNETIETLVIPHTVTYIGEGAFQNCKNLKSVTLPRSVTHIADGAFEGCSALTEITLPEYVTVIGKRAFAHCSALTAITLPDTLSEIADETFYVCSALERVTIPNSVSAVGENAFFGCLAIKEANLSADLLAAIPKGKLQTLHITSGTTIAEGALENCTNLESVTFDHATVYNFGARAFQNCIKLKSFYHVGGDINHFGADAFRGCEALTTVDIGSIHGWFDITFDNEYANPMYYSHGLYSRGEEVLNLPYGSDPVTEIKPYAFIHFDALTIVNIYDTTERVGEYAFYGCENLEGVVIHSGTREIAKGAFADCDALEQLAFMQTSGWTVSPLKGATSGTSIDVSDSWIAAAQMRGSYELFYWKRS